MAGSIPAFAFVRAGAPSRGSTSSSCSACRTGASRCSRRPWSSSCGPGAREPHARKIPAH